MAVPVINTVSKTKTSGYQFRNAGWHSAENLATAYPNGSHTTNTDVTLTGVPDRYRIHFFFQSHGGVNHDGGVKIQGATSGTDIHDSPSTQLPSYNHGIINLVKNTGQTEDVLVKLGGTHGSSGFHSNSGLVVGCSAGDMTYLPIPNGGNARVKSTMQIDSIDIVAIQNSAQDIYKCPALGYYSNHRVVDGIGSLANNVPIQTLTPNRMINELEIFGNGSQVNTTSEGSTYEGFQGILYSYTGKELSIS